MRLYAACDTKNGTLAVSPSRRSIRRWAKHQHSTIVFSRQHLAIQSALQAGVKFFKDKPTRPVNPPTS